MPKSGTLGKNWTSYCAAGKRTAPKYGALLTTGRCSDEARALLLRHNQNEKNRPVRLIDGDDLADLFLRYFPPATDRASYDRE